MAVKHQSSSSSLIITIILNRFSLIALIPCYGAVVTVLDYNSPGHGSSRANLSMFVGCFPDESAICFGRDQVTSLNKLLTLIFR